MPSVQRAQGKEKTSECSAAAAAAAAAAAKPQIGLASGERPDLAHRSKHVYPTHSILNILCTYGIGSAFVTESRKLRSEIQRSSRAQIRLQARV